VIATAKPPADYNPKTLITVACATVDSLGEHSRTEEQSCALTLSLPNGTLRATGNSKNVLTGCKKAFSEIETQVKKHQSRLRRDHEWKGKRPIE
jgi:ribosome-associated translation inhibitor RaiA